MKMKKNIMMAAVAVVSMVSASAVANAAVDITYGIAATEFSTANVTKTGIVPAAKTATIATPATGLALQAGDTVTFTVAGGAVFEPATLTGALPTAADATAPTPAVIALTGCVLSAANTVLTCTSAASPTAALAATFTWNAAATLDMTAAVAGTPATIDVAVSRTILGTASVVHSAAAPGAMINVNAAIQKGVAVTGTTDVADVTTQFKKFSPANAPVLVTAATTGGGVGSVGDTANMTIGSPTAASGLYLLTLSGLPTAATSVTLAGVAGSDATGAAKAATGGGNFWLDGAGKGYGFLTAAAAGNAVAVPTLAGLVITVDGVNPIAAGTTTLAVDYVAGAGDVFVSHNMMPATAVSTITRNGGSFTSDNISPSSVIRISDNGATTAVAGAIAYTAWDAAGAAVTQIGATLPTSVLGGNTVTIAKGVLKAAFPTAVRFNITIESGNVSVTHFKSNAAGLNVTVGSTGTAKQL